MADLRHSSHNIPYNHDVAQHVKQNKSTVTYLPSTTKLPQLLPLIHITQRHLLVPLQVLFF